MHKAPDDLPRLVYSAFVKKSSILIKTAHNLTQIRFFMKKDRQLCQYYLSEAMGGCIFL